MAAAALYFMRGRKPDLRFAAGYCAGLAAPLLLTAVYFARLGALRELIYYTLTYNSAGAAFAFTPLYCAGAALAVAAAFLLLRALKTRASGGLFFFCAAAVFLGLLLLAYPVLEHQTVLPFRLMVYALAAGLTVKYGIARLSEERRGAACFAVFAGLLAFQLHNTGALRNANGAQLACIKRITALTGENDYVMDAKGESVFRRRPFYYGLELLAMRRMAAGEIADDIPEKLQATGTKLVLLWFPARFTQKDRGFFAENYLPVDGQPELLAAGKLVRPGAAGRPAPFDMNIAADYSVTCTEGKGRISLDGRPYTGAPVRLERGQHTAAAAAGCGELRLNWAGAAGRPA
jgi:hypothetical protein